MRVAVLGGTGVVGHRAVRALVTAGHDVTALVRRADAGPQVEAWGAQPVQVAIDDRSGLSEALRGHDAVVNLATSIPPFHTAALPRSWRANDHIRRVGAPTVAAAALDAGVGRYIQEALAFRYADGGDAWLDEDAPLLDPPPNLVTSMPDAEAAVAGFTAAGGVGVVLRFGMFHALDSSITSAGLVLTRYGWSPSPGRADAYTPVLDADDAADAVVAALGVPAGIYNIVGDDPPTRGAYAAAVADAVGARHGLRPLPAAALSLVNRDAAYLANSNRVSNRRFREATGWEPRRSSLPVVVEDASAHERGRVHAGRAAAAVAFLAVAFAVPGLWALLAPESFYDTFPGVAGWRWVASDGPFNEHLVRDVGAFFTAFAALSLWALVSMHRVLVRAVGLVTLVFGVPHVGYHLTHADALVGSARWGSLLSLSAQVLLGAYLVVATRPARPGATAGGTR